VGSRATAEGRSAVAHRWVAAHRWAAVAGSRMAARRWAAGSCGSPRDKVAVAVLSLCGRGCQNETSQCANLLRSRLGRSRLL
jgi:hypothetical protein